MIPNDQEPKHNAAANNSKKKNIYDGGRQFGDSVLVWRSGTCRRSLVLVGVPQRIVLWDSLDHSSSEPDLVVLLLLLFYETVNGFFIVRLYPSVRLRIVWHYSVT